MIRINLAQTMAARTATMGASIDDSIPMDSENIKRDGAIRLFILLLIPIAMKAYESQKLPELNSQLNSKTTLFNSLKEKNAKAKTAVDEIKHFSEDQARLRKQIDIVEGLQKERLLEVKILDNVQKDIPNKVWLNRIEILEGKFAVIGQTTTDSDLTLFMENLGKSVFLKDVNLIKSEDVPTEKGNLKRFDIQCLIDKPVGGVKK